MLSTEKLPVPSTTLIDHKLVKELGLKLNDVQCSKFSYARQKFRILGKISQTIQTVNNGVILDTAHTRASVVENLSESLILTALLERKWRSCYNHLQQAQWRPPPLRDHQDPQLPADQNQDQLPDLQLQIAPEPVHLQQLSLLRPQHWLSIISRREENTDLRETELNLLRRIRLLGNFLFLHQRISAGQSTGES